MKRSGLCWAGLLAVAVFLGSCARSGEVESDRRVGAAEGAESSWMHRVSLERDLPYGDDPQQRLDVYLQGTWTRSLSRGSPPAVIWR